MNIVFMGTPEFAVASLAILLKNNFNVVGVVTAPDKPAGRGREIRESAVKKFASQNNLKLLQPEKLKDEGFIIELKNLNADLQIVVAFRMLPEIVWNMPKMGTYNLHASLLPKFRGAAPINWAIIKGEKESGITTFKLQHEIDTGNILFQEKVTIDDNDCAGDLHDKLMGVGAQLILKTVKEIDLEFKGEKKLNFISQINSEASHAPKIFKETCKINWNDSVANIHDLVRGLSPYPAAYCEMGHPGAPNQILKLFKTKLEILDHPFTNGLHITDGATFIKIYCNGGTIEITDLQLEGKKRMPVSDFLRGFKFKADTKFL